MLSIRSHRLARLSCVTTVALLASLVVTNVAHAAAAKVTLTASPKTAFAAQSVTLAGKVTNGVAGQRVTLEFQAQGSTAFKVGRSVAIAADKSFSFSFVAPLGSTKFHVRASAKRSVAPGVSPVVTVSGLPGAASSPAVAGEKTTVRGVLPQPRRRAVELQHKQGAKWVKLASATSSAQGAVSVPYTASATQLLRLFAPAVTVGRGPRARVIAPAFTSGQVKVEAVTQSLTLTVPDNMCTSKAYDASVAFTPARAGRTMRLEASSDSGATWSPLATATQPASGATTTRSFNAPDTSASFQFRVVIDATSAVPGATSAVVTKPVADCDSVPISYPYVAVGSASSCLIDANRDTWCWGDNSEGGLGDGTTTMRTTQVKVTGGLKFKVITVGTYHACGLVDDGTAYCWGNNDDTVPQVETGAIGDGTEINRPSPTPVSGGLKFKAIDAGQGSTCGITTNNLTFCWGNNDNGQLGNGAVIDHIQNNQNQLTPALVGGFVFKSIDTDAWRTCALTTNGTPYCWGAGLQSNDTNVPTAVNTSEKFVSIDVGNYSACARRSDGTTFCWGQDSDGVLGVAAGVDDSSPDPKLVAGGPYSFVGVGLTACAFNAAGAAQCWGDNLMGGLGDGHGGASINSKGIPVNVNGGLVFRQMSVGYAHTCGVTTGGAVYCWGQNWQRQVVAGSANVYFDVPTKVYG